MLKLDFYNKTSERISKKFFPAILKKAGKILRHAKILKSNAFLTVELAFVGKRTIAKLNAAHRGKSGPTDVISLSYFNKRMKDNFAGEIFICLPFARSQAQKLGHSLRDEFKFLFAHGLLHIFGFKHDSAAAKRKMNKFTAKILSVQMNQASGRWEIG